MERKKCKKQVCGSGQWGAFHTHQCSHWTIEGKEYCNLHDPERFEKRDAEEQAKRDAERTKEEELRGLFPELFPDLYSPWVSVNPKVAGFKVEFNGLTEEQVRKLAEVISKGM